MPARVVMTYGRFNPPTRAHEELVKTLKDYALQEQADPRVYTSKTEGDITNPLPFDQKVYWLERVFGPIVWSMGGIIEILQSIEKEGVQELTIMLGSDRIDQFSEMISKYNGLDFSIPQIKFFKFGKSRVYLPHGDIESISASLIRGYAMTGMGNGIDLLPNVLPSGEKQELYRQLGCYLAELNKANRLS